MMLLFKTNFFSFWRCPDGLITDAGFQHDRYCAVRISLNGELGGGVTVDIQGSGNGLIPTNVRLFSAVGSERCRR